MFTVRLQDSDLKLLDEGPFDLTKEVEIAATKDELSNDAIVLMKGEIVALEPEFNEAMIAELVIRGYDKSHRLYRETKSRVFLNVKDSDLAEEIAQSVGLQAEISPATSVVYEHIYQDNQSDLTFLQHRAFRIGYECFVEDGKLYFRRPVNSGSEVELTWGRDLTSFHIRATVAEQVKEVIVKGWDAERQTPIVGRASNGQLYPELQNEKNGTEWATKFGSSAGNLVIVDEPVVNQAEADTLAAARLDEISGAFIEATGIALRRPDLRAGRRVQIRGLGKRFSGSYLVTNATHTYRAEGLTTTFTVRGVRPGLLVHQIAPPTSVDRWPSVVTAVVTKNDDPKGWGRVKVRYPWMSEDAESDWARITGSGAGDEAGYMAIPEVDDEVVVAFSHGNFGQPIVLGGLWHGKAMPPPEVADAAGSAKAQLRTWRSHKGHRITFDDSSGALEIEAVGTLEIKASGDIKLESSGEVTIKGTMINLNP
jgi:phage protein D/phage baseplate assembly protein gpV